MDLYLASYGQSTGVWNLDTVGAEPSQHANLSTRSHDTVWRQAIEEELDGLIPDFQW